MSVDTYARKKSYDAYRRVRERGVELLVAHTLATRAFAVSLDMKRFLLWKRLTVSALLAGHAT